MDRKRTRSSSGMSLCSASHITRLLKSTQDSSRLRYRSDAIVASVHSATCLTRAYGRRSGPTGGQPPESGSLSDVPRIRADSIEAHKELTRRELLGAAHDLIEEIQSADISLADVAAEVGIGRTTLYEYFRDKDDLIAAMVEERLPEVIERLLVETAGGGLHERLEALAVATVEFIVEDHVLGLILHRELPRLSPDAQQRIRHAHQDLAGEMVGIYLEGVQAGLFRPMAPDIAGRLMNEVILAAAKILIGAPDPASRLNEVTTAMTAFLMAGLGAGRTEY